MAFCYPFFDSSSKSHRLFLLQRRKYFVRNLFSRFCSASISSGFDPVSFREKRQVGQIRIGVIFTDDARGKSRQKAFKAAIAQINSNPSLLPANTEFALHSLFTNGSSFHLSKIVCSALENPKSHGGFHILYGPSDMRLRKVHWLLQATVYNLSQARLSFLHTTLASNWLMSFEPIRTRYRPFKDI